MLEVKNHDFSEIKFPSETIQIMLVQEEYPQRLIGLRAGEGIYTGTISPKDDKHLQNEVLGILRKIPSTKDIAIISEHPGNVKAFELFQEHSNKNRQIIIARLGYYTRESDIFNSVAVFIPDESEPCIINQTSFSVEDYERKMKNNSLKSDHVINILNFTFGKMAIINCHDYTNVSVVEAILKEKIDVLIVPTFNPSSSLFVQYAISDIHRLFCFVIVSNIANFGGSGVYGPFRYNGKKYKSISINGSFASLQGECVGYLDVALPLGKLRSAREELASSNVFSKKIENLNDYPPILPSERFLSDKDPEYEEVLRDNKIEIVNMKDIGYMRTDEEQKINIAIAHLEGMGVDEYKKTNYHISNSAYIANYVENIRYHLELLEKNLKLKNKQLDFLVFPEVYIPTGLVEELIKFSNKHNTIIIFGEEYDTNGFYNNCKVIIPTKEQGHTIYEYCKLSRSKYDSPTKKVGSKLLKFQSHELCNFAVLICYDYSHLDILHRINTIEENPTTELLFVVAYNPDAKLYKNCCLADSHRYYQYIAMCNVSQFGGSGVFGPIKKTGERQTLLNTGENNEGISMVSLDINGLRDARGKSDLEQIGFSKKPGIFQIC